HVPFSYNIRNLMVRWPTTLLTAVAFVLVVALMTVMLAFVNGMYVLSNGSSVPGNVMVLQDGSTDEIFSDIGQVDIKKLENYESHPYVKSADLNRGKKEALVSFELFQVINQELPNAAETGRQRRFIQVRGIYDPVISAYVHELSIRDGIWFD